VASIALTYPAWDPPARELAVTAVREAAALATKRRGPVGVADTGDNINGGSPGDTTWLLHAASTYPEIRVASTLTDPGSVAAAESAGVGGRFDAELGGKAEPSSGDPVRGEAMVRWVGDGTFVNTGPMARGARVSMGRAAVVRIGNADIILQSSAVQPNDPAMFRAVGLDPGDYQLILLKGAAALGAGWFPITSGFVDAGTPGITDVDLRRLPYRHARSWPLDTAHTQDRG
jgi:microcystin degradation protein MlrC